MKTISCCLVAFRFVLKCSICTMWRKKTTLVYREKHRRLIHANGSTILNRSIIYDWWFWSMELQTSRLSFVRFVRSPFYLKPFDLFRSKSWAMAIDEWLLVITTLSYIAWFEFFFCQHHVHMRMTLMSKATTEWMNEWRCCTAVPLWFQYLWHGMEIYLIRENKNKHSSRFKVKRCMQLVLIRLLNCQYHGCYCCF